MTFAPDIRRRTANKKPTHRNRRISHAGKCNVVPLSIFSIELERIVTKLQREIEDETGALYLLAERLANNNGHKPARYARRLWDWRNDKRRAIPADVVDRIYAAAGERHTDLDTPICELPAGREAARIMVDTWCPDWDELEKLKLATSLRHFAEGACLGWDVIDLEVCNSLEAFFLSGPR